MKPESNRDSRHDPCFHADGLLFNLSLCERRHRVALNTIDDSEEGAQIKDGIVECQMRIGGESTD